MTVAGVRWVDGPAVAVEVVRSDVLEGDERGLEDNSDDGSFRPPLRVWYGGGGESTGVSYSSRTTH